MKPQPINKTVIQFRDKLAIPLDSDLAEHQGIQEGTRIQYILLRVVSDTNQGGELETFSNNGETPRESVPTDSKITLVNMRKKNTRIFGGVSQKRYEPAIVQYLSEHNGRGYTRNIKEGVYHIMEPHLTNVDFEELDSGGLRWEKNFNFAGTSLRKKGLLKRDSPRGVWELSEFDGDKTK